MRPPVRQSLAVTTRRPSTDGGALRRATMLARRLGPTAALAIAAALLPVLGGITLYGRLGGIAAWLRSGATSAALLCVAAFAVTGGLAVVPTYAMSVVCGWSFGFTIGLGATLGSFLGAALIGYAIAAAADGGRALALVCESPRWLAIHRALSTGSFAKLTAVVAMVRLAPVTPFSLTSTAMAALRVPVLPYAAGTLLGMAPRAVVVTYFASRMTTPAGRTIAGGGPWFLVVALAATLAVVWALAWLGRQGLARLAAEA